MLLQVTIENVLSFRDEVVFSLLASPEIEHREGQATRPFNGGSALRVAAIYGANAAGKSNLLKALAMARDLIVEGTRPGKPIRRHPFKLTRQHQARPSRMEFHWHFGEVWSYGFSVDEERVHEEWLTVDDEPVFQRSGADIEVFDCTLLDPGRLSFFTTVGVGTRPEQLFLSQAWELNAGELAVVMRWWEGFKFIDSSTELPLPRPSSRHDLWLDKLLRMADTGVHGLSWKRPEGASPLPLKEWFEDAEPRFHHRGGDSGCDLGLEEESQGTVRLLGLSGPLSDAFWRTAPFLVIDELDSSLHALLARALIKTFLSFPEHVGGQLLFTTHDTQLLDTKLVPRDGIWFVEKDRMGGSSLHSLAEYKVDQLERIDFERGYLQGRFGAIPFLGDPTRLGWSGGEEE